MLKKLTIKNFKAIQEMTIEFSPLTVLIGENSCGKSTILQAIDFLRSAAFRDIPEYLKEKRWEFNDLKSHQNQGQDRPIEFITTWGFIANGSAKSIEWFLSIDKDKKWIINEKITDNFDNRIILSFSSNGQANTPPFIGQINIQSSVLKYIAGTSFNTDEIDPLFNFLSDSSNFDVLSPEKMREGKVLPYSHNIGINGEALAYCIDKMNDKEKLQLNDTVSHLLGYKIEVQTYNHRAKIELLVNFIIDNKKVSIDSSHISDGLLRIIAFVVISMEKENLFLITENGLRLVTEDEKPISVGDKILKTGMILLDEIENGINPYLTEKIIALLRNVENLGRQIIITTHSPVILDEIKQEEIIFLWKDNTGSVHAKKFFDTDEMKQLLEALNPGEVWINLEKDEILKRLSSEKEENQ